MLLTMKYNQSFSLIFIKPLLLIVVIFHESWRKGIICTMFKMVALMRKFCIVPNVVIANFSFVGRYESYYLGMDVFGMLIKKPVCFCLDLSQLSSSLTLKWNHESKTVNRNILLWFSNNSLNIFDIRLSMPDSFAFLLILTYCL